MPTITIPLFAGETPRVEPRLLETQQASTAINCSLNRGSLRPLRGLKEVSALINGAKTLFKHDTDGWLSWTRDVNVVKSAVVDVIGETPLGHLYLTGDRAYPTQRLAGGETCRLGIPRPESAPTVTVDANAALSGALTVRGFGAATEAGVPMRYGNEGLAEVQPDRGSLMPFTAKSIDGLADEDDKGDEDKKTDTDATDGMRSTSYCYTLVRSLAGGLIQQESAPSPPSPVIDIGKGDGALVSGFVVPKLDGLAVTAIRLYRTVSGTEAANFRFVAEFPVSTAKYKDTIHDKDISADILRTSIWDPIPDDATGLIKTDNGLYAAFRGNELLVSEPFVPYAFPEPYRLTVEDRIVALAHVDSTIVILTTGRPYLAQGSVPESLQLVHLPIEQACVSAHSVGFLPGGIVYASPDGLMLFTSNEQTLLTGGVYTREQWQALHPENLLGAVLDDRYVGFFRGTNTGFILDLNRRDIVRVAFADGSQVNGLYHHSNDDCLYLAFQTGGKCGACRFEDGEPLAYTWRSKLFFTSTLTGLSAVRVEGEQKTGQPVLVKVFGPRMDRPKCRVRLTEDRTRRLPLVRSEKIWCVELSGTSPVHELRLGSSVEDLEHGN